MSDLLGLLGGLAPEAPPAPLPAPIPEETQQPAPASTVEREKLLAEMGLGTAGAGPEAFHLLRGAKAAMQPGDSFDDEERQALTKQWRSLDSAFDEEPPPRMVRAKKRPLLAAISTDEAVEALWQHEDRQPLPSQQAVLATFVEAVGDRLLAGVPGHQAGAFEPETGRVVAAAWELSKFAAAMDDGVFAGADLAEVRKDYQDLLENPDRLNVERIDRLADFVAKFAAGTSFAQSPNLRWDPDVKLAAVAYDGENVAPVFAWSRPSGPREELDFRDVYRYGLENIRRVFEAATPEERQQGVDSLFADEGRVAEVMAMRSKGWRADLDLDNALAEHVGEPALDATAMAVFTGGAPVPKGDTGPIADAYREVAAQLGVTVPQLRATVAAAWSRLRESGEADDVVGFGRAIVEDGSTTMTPAALLRHAGPVQDIPPAAKRVLRSSQMAVVANGDGTMTIVGDNPAAVKEQLRTGVPSSPKGAAVWLPGHAEPGEVQRLEPALADLGGESFRAFLHPGLPSDHALEPGNRIVIRGLDAGDEALVYGGLRKLGLDTTGGSVAPLGDHYEILPAEDDQPSVRRPSRGLVVNLPDDVTRQEVEQVLATLEHSEPTDVALYLHGATAAPKGYARVWEQHWDSPHRERFTLRTAADVDPTTPNSTPVWVRADEASTLTTKPWRAPERGNKLTEPPEGAETLTP